MTAQCCNCQKVRSPQGWRMPIKAELITKQVTHTYCPTCYSEARLYIEKWKRDNA
jgi:hypothetical protein